MRVPPRSKKMACMAPECDGPDLLRALKKDTLGYVISLGPLGLGGLAVLPLMTQLLTPAELGWLAVAEALLLPAGTLGMMGLKFAYLYRYAHSTPEEQRSTMTTCLALGASGGLACGLLATGLAMHPVTLRLLDWTAPVPLQLPWLMALQVPAGTLHALLITELRAQRRVAATAVVSYIQLGATLVCTVLFTVVLPWGLDGFMAGGLAGNVVGIVAVMSMLLAADAPAELKPMRPRVDWAKAPDLLRFGWPLTAGLLVRYGMDTASRLMLAAMASLEAAADWLVVSRALSVFDAFVANPFLMAWGGLVHHALRRADAEQVVSQVSRWTLFASSLAALTTAISFLLITKLMTDSSRPELTWLFVLLLWVKWLALLKSPLCCGVQQTGDTRWALSNNALALAVFVPAAFVLMQLPHPWGDAHGMAACMLLATLLPSLRLYHCSQRIVHQRLGAVPWLVAGAALGLTGAFAWWTCSFNTCLN